MIIILSNRQFSIDCKKNAKNILVLLYEKIWAEHIKKKGPDSWLKNFKPTDFRL